MKKFTLISSSLLTTIVLCGQFNKIDTSFFSEALQETKMVDVYFPPGYDENPDWCYPVIYYLHGWTGDQNTMGEMLSTVQTAEEVAILRDALRYREAVARKDQAKAKVADKPPVAKPSAKKSTQTDKQRQRKQARARMQKNGGIDDVANFLLS